MPLRFRRTTRPWVPGISRSAIARSGGVFSAWASARAPSCGHHLVAGAGPVGCHLAQIAASSSTTSTRTPVGVDSLDAAASAVIELVCYASERDRGAVPLY